MKATEQFFTVVQFIMLYKVVLTLESGDEILKCDMTIQMKVTEQSFLVVLFIILYQVVLSFESVNEIRKCLSCGIVYRQTRYVKNSFIYYINTNEIAGELLRENLWKFHRCYDYIINRSFHTIDQKTIKVKWFGSSLVFI